jgi:hypothetical protein
MMPNAIEFENIIRDTESPSDRSRIKQTLFPPGVEFLTLFYFSFFHFHLIFSRVV